MRCGKVKNGGGGSGTNIGHSGTDFVGLRGSLELDIVKNAHVLPMDGRLAGWHPGWPRAGMNENDGLRNGKKKCKHLP